MKKAFRTLSIVAVCFAVAALAQEEKQKVKTINVHFESLEEEGMVFNLTLPISFLESVKPKIQEALTSIDFQGQEIDLVAIWNSVRDSGPMEYLEIHNEDADVKVSTNDTHLLVKVLEKDEGQDIDITIPLALGDALFSQEDLSDIDYDRIIEALLALEGQDLLKITSNTVKGKVWID